MEYQVDFKNKKTKEIIKSIIVESNPIEVIVNAKLKAIADRYFFNKETDYIFISPIEDENKNNNCWTYYLSSKSPENKSKDSKDSKESEKISIEESIVKFRELYCELSKVCNGFTNKQRDKILKICFENICKNHGISKSYFEVMINYKGDKI